MHISLGFSPCPNDTFMFAALVNQWIDTEGFVFDVHMNDVEQLNQWAGSGFLDITKLSFHRGFSVENTYELLNAGAALGKGCGPLVISSSPRSDQEINEGPVVLPGQWTTAHLLFQIFYPRAMQKTFVVFNEIEEMVKQEKVVAGVIIHENRFTYASKGLVKIADLGELWEQQTSMPIPLGGIFMKRSFSEKIRSTIDRLISKSIQFAFDHPARVMPYVRNYAQEMDLDVIRQHINLYVNSYSLDLGPSGHEAIRLLKKSLPGF
jgi:1,4-dihydroxy-6-naphthoate synthase